MRYSLFSAFVYSLLVCATPSSAQIQLSFSFVEPSCNGLSNGSASSSVSGGSEPYTYQWGNGQSGPSLQNISAGDYSLTVTDNIGQTAVGTVSVTEPESIDVTVAVTNITCNDDPNSGAAIAVVMNGVQPYHYLWEDGSTTSDRIGIPAGTYSVTVTDANGCSNSGSGTVMMPSIQLEAVSVIPACGGANTGSITVVASGGIDPYTFLWSPGGQNTQTISNLAPGQYTVTATDANNCVATLTVTVPEISSLAVTIQIVSAECTGVDDGVASVFVNPPGNYEYNWNIPPFHGVTQLMGLPVGTFVAVTVTDPISGCTGTASATVGAHNAIHIDVVDVDVVCAGQNNGSAIATASNGTPDYQYVWLLPPSGPVLGNGPSITGLAPGAYMVSVTDSRGCTAISVADIGLDSDPTAAINGLNLIECGDTSSQVQFTNASFDLLNSIESWQWTLTTGAGTQTFSNISPLILDLPVGSAGTTTLVVTSTAGCSDTATVDFVVPGLPNFSLSPDTVLADCSNAPVHLTVNGGQPWYVYQWSPLTGLTLDSTPPNATADPSETTTYTLVAQDQGCIDSVSVTVVRLPAINIEAEIQEIETCDSLFTLVAESKTGTIIWVNAAGDTLGSPPYNPVVVVTGPTTIYTAIATNVFGCMDSIQVSVTGVWVDVDIDPMLPDTMCECDTIVFGIINNHPNDTLSYHWSSVPPLNFDTATSSNPEISGTPGDYVITVVVTNQFGCMDTLEYSLHILKKDTIDTEITIDLCDGLKVSFFNTSGYPGTWNFGDGTTSMEQNPMHTYATEGQYLVSFITADSLCVAHWDSLIQVIDTIMTDPVISCDLITCIDSVQYQFGATTTGPFISTWLWVFEGGDPGTSTSPNPTVTYHEEGTYTVTLTITNINGCTATATKEVEVFILQDNIDWQLETCIDSLIKLNPDGIDSTATYLWMAEPADATLIPTDKNPCVHPLVSTVYSVVITDGLNCSSTGEVRIVFLERPEVNLPEDMVVCEDTALVVVAVGTGISYEWSDTLSFDPIFDHDATAEIIPQKDGIYYVRTYSSDGCIAMDSIKINNAQLDIDVSPWDAEVCLGEDIDLDINNLDPEDILQFDWTPDFPNAGNITVGPTADTTYTVFIENQFHCKDTLEFGFSVNWVTADATVTGRDTICPGLNTTLLATAAGNGAPHSFLWSPGSTLNDETIPDPTATPIEEQVYVVTVTDAVGCTATDEVTIYFISEQCVEPYIFVPKAFTPNHDSHNDFFIVRGVNITELKFIVWDRWGEKVYETTDPHAVGWDGTFNGKELTPDSYAWYLQARCGNGAIYEKKGDVTLLK